MEVDNNTRPLLITTLIIKRFTKQTNPIRMKRQRYTEVQLIEAEVTSLFVLNLCQAYEICQKMKSTHITKTATVIVHQVTHYKLPIWPQEELWKYLVVFSLNNKKNKTKQTNKQIKKNKKSYFQRKKKVPDCYKHPFFHTHTHTSVKNMQNFVGFFLLLFFLNSPSLMSLFSYEKAA